MSKQTLSSSQLYKLKQQALDDIAKLEGTGKYRGDMGNMCYADGHFANSIMRKYECNDIAKIKRWAKS